MGILRKSLSSKGISIIFNLFMSILLVIGLAAAPSSPAAAATQIDIPGPQGSGEFGHSVTVLLNGKIVVCDPLFDDGNRADVGAVYLYDGASGNLISKLTGSKAGDRVGLGGVTALTNSNYVVRSFGWDNGAGAVTWGDETSGISGAVSAANSLVGSTAGDQVGLYGVTALTNGNYVVRSFLWDNGAGAVTWGDGTSGISGVVSAANSLVGSTAGDQVGVYVVTELTNGNYVVRSPYWDNGALVDAGAATWGDGASGISGAVSAANSLVGSKAGDQVGFGGVTALTNGDYVVSSPYWHNGAVVNAGAATWGDGASGISGAVSAANSLVGSTAGDNVGIGGATALTNGNFVVSSPNWDNGAVVNAGAATWGDGTSGIGGAVSTANSLVGSTASDYVGVGGVMALTDGNYVVSSPNWDNGTVVDAGAVTWGDETSGISGAVSAANSLVGSTAGDQVGYWVTTLTNGNYVVRSPNWDNGAIVDAGAVTWGDGSTGTFGPITPENSVRGTSSGGGNVMNFSYDDVNVQLVVGRLLDNIVTLFRPNRAPLADAGPDQIVMSQATVTLDGSASNDPDGNLPLAFSWEQSGGTPVTLSGSDTANPTFTAPPVITQTKVLTFTLVVSDTLGMPSLADEVVISVEPYSELLPLILGRK